MEDFIGENIQSLKDFVFDENAYKKYLDKWLDGIEEELYFWKDMIENKGHGDPNWNVFISNDRIFQFDKYLNLKETKFLDAGSGPFSSCGNKTNKTRLKFMAVDPLAYIYEELKQRNGVTTGIKPEYSMVERLNEKFQKNSFDIVHMRNSLDHSFNPLVGIFQMLSICTIGGKILLQHLRNEAENANYNGFHQWNLCLEDSEFIVWRPKIKYNITRILKEYADFDMVDELTDESWFTVILTKKKDVPGLEIQKTIVSIIDDKVFKKLSELIVFDAYKKRREKISILKKKISVLKRTVKKMPFIGGIIKKMY